MKPEVSIVMPIYNTVSRNGTMIHTAINSLLNQTFKDFQLLILDNLSTDDTQEICTTYAKQDSRIRFFIDSKQRFPEGGINKLCEMVDTPYMMIANDDDKWEPSYIEKLYKILQSNKDIDAAYTNGSFMSVTDNVGGVIIPKGNEVDYTKDVPTNFFTFIQTRNVIPLLFGLFRTESYKKCLPYTPFDTLKANVDNIFAAKFFLFGGKSFLLNEHLFYYRNKPRKLEEGVVEGMPKNPTLIWIFYVAHQLNFYMELTKNFPNNITYRIVTLDSCLQRLPALIKWVLKDVTTKESDKRVVSEVYSMLPQPRKADGQITIGGLTNEINNFMIKIEEILHYIDLKIGYNHTVNTLRYLMSDVNNSIQGD